MRTYQLAYLNGEVSLCQTCLDRNDHGLGSIGPVSHGEHKGECDSPTHAPVVRHFRSEDGVGGYHEGDILVDDTTGERSLVVRDGRGLCLQPIEAGA